MGPGGRRPNHLSTEGQMVPTSELMNPQASRLLQNLVALPQSCEGPSGCNEATRLGLQWEACLPQCNRGLFAWRLGGPQGPKDGSQLACPPFGVRFRSGWRSLVGSVGMHINLQYSFLIKLASLSGKYWKKL